MLLVDPFLLLWPESGDWPDAVQAVIRWSDAATTRDDVYYSGTCTARLMSEGLFPYANAFELTPRLVAEGQGISARDLLTVVRSLLEKARQVESRCESVLCANVTLVPATLHARLADEPLAGCLGDALVAFWILHEPPCTSMTVATRPDAIIPSEATHQLEANVAMVEGYAERELELPLALASNVEIRFAPPTASIGLAHLTRHPREAIVAEHSQLPLSERTDFPLKAFTVDPSFVASLTAVNCDEKLAAIILKQASRIFSGQESRFPKMNVHWERVGPGANDAQVERGDGFKAFRAELTSRGAGYRLLYWKKGASYELWQVRTESDH